MTTRAVTTLAPGRGVRLGLRLGTGLVLALAVGAPLAACSNINEDTYPPTDGGADGGLVYGPTIDTGDGGTFTLKPFAPPSDPGGGGVLLTASGEALALTGYPFPPANAGDPAFVDGWDVKFRHLIVTLGKVTLSDNPDTAPGDPSETGGIVAEVDGPWAIDLSRSDGSYLAGKGGPGEKAVPFAAFTNENRNGGASFATDGTRYAFGFDTVGATPDAINVNLDAEALGDYLAMIGGGCSVYYDGTATFKGDASCNGGDYATWPKVVHFALCFAAPTTYENCQNPDNQGTPFANEEAQRGLALYGEKSAIAQVTIHSDHPFWDSVLHDAPLHFDQFAARVVGKGSEPTVSLADTRGVDYTAYTDANGKALDWRYCIDPPTDAHPKLVGAMAFDPESVPHAASGDATTGLRDYADFATYDQSTQGHLNSDGLCFVRRDYPSPP